MHRHRSLAVLLCAAALSSCNWFDETGARAITAPVASARIKFHNFSPSSVGVNFFANDQKMTAVLTSVCGAPATAADSLACSTTGIESTTGVAYGGVASGGRYDAIAPGQYTLAAKVAAKPDVVSSLSQAIGDGKYYSFFMSGVYNTTSKTAEAFVVEDPIPTGPADYTVANVRFVNAVSNGTGPLTLYLTNAETKAETAIGSAVAYKSAGAFVTIPPGTYSLAARYSGSTTNVITRTGLAFLGGGVYTVTARGSTATTSTLGFDFTENQR
jgi:uncharacterized protein DUF4397